VKAREPFPIIYANDVEFSAAFYRDAFGFEQTFRWPKDGKPGFVFLRLEPLGIGISAVDEDNVHGRPVEPGSGAFELCIYVDDMKDACERLRRLGAPELRAPQDEPWGESRAYFADLDGNVIHLAQRL
jgi:lactoylglutathione lyase